MAESIKIALLANTYNATMKYCVQNSMSRSTNEARSDEISEPACRQAGGWRSGEDQMNLAERCSGAFVLALVGHC